MAKLSAIFFSGQVPTPNSKYKIFLINDNNQIKEQHDEKIKIKNAV